VKDYYQVIKLTMILLIGVAALIVIPETSKAQGKAALVCVDSRGKVVVRPKCRPGESKLSLTALEARAPSGALGASGDNGASGYEVVSTTLDNQSIAAEGTSFSQQCPAGKTTVGGGCYASSNFVVAYQSFPFDSNPRLWRCGFASRSEGSPTSSRVILYAICVDE